MFPALDVTGYRRRTVLSAIASSYIDEVETAAPGLIQKRIQVWTARIYAQLRKRYGRGVRLYAIPFGQGAPALTPQGTTPPAVTLSGTPTVGSLEIIIQITTLGAVGTAVFQWSKDDGVSWTTGVLTAPTVLLSGTGITAAFAAGTYAIDNVYTAPPPITETFLDWLVVLTDLEVLQARGTSNDIDRKVYEDRAARVLAEVKEAADSKDGLFDLPTNDAGDSAVSTGGPLSYSESSPFVSADRQEHAGHLEDARGFGTYGGSG